MMVKICCDLCERDMSNDENKTRVTLEDENGFDFEFGLFFRSPRKIRIDICDKCLKLLKNKGEQNGKNSM